jgi:hypothetical protein
MCSEWLWTLSALLNDPAQSACETWRVSSPVLAMCLHPSCRHGGNEKPQKLCSPHRSSSEGAGGGAGAITISAVEPRCKRKKKKEAERQKTLIRILCTLRYSSRLARRARLPAFHHGSCQRDFGPQGSAPGQASWDVVSTGVTRCLLSQSGGCTPHTGHSTGEHDAQSRPGVAVTSRYARAPHPVPINQGHRLTSFKPNGIERH